MVNSSEKSSFKILREGNNTYLSVESNESLKKIPVAVYSHEMLETLIEKRREKREKNKGGENQQRD